MKQGQTTRNYVYKLCSTKAIFADLDSAITGAYFDVITLIPSNIKVTHPIVTKIQGGYSVTLIAQNGKAYTRQIDVFEPINTSGLFTTKHTKMRYRTYGWQFTDEQMEELQKRIKEVEDV